MLANDITLDKADGTDVVFKLVSQDQNGTRRLDVASTLALPTTLIIKHSVTGKDPLLIDRHLIQLNKTVAAAIGTATVNLNFTLSIPRNVAITNTIIADMVSHLIDFLLDGTLTGYATHANVDAILRGES
jgi:hypothetical protein